MIIAAERPRLPAVEEGMYTSVCTGLIDQGIQRNEKFGNSSQKIRLIFELVGETYEMNNEEHVRQVGRDFTLSLSEKSNLRAFLESWRGKAFSSDELNGFDLRQILGAAGQLQIIHKEGKNGNYAFVNNMVPLTKGTPVPKAENRQVYFDMSDPDTYGEYEMLPDFLKETISNAENFDDTGLGLSLDDDLEDAASARPAPAQKAPAAKALTAPATAEPPLDDEDDGDLSFDIKVA